MPFADHESTTLRRLALASVHHESHLRDQELEISTTANVAAYIKVEVEYWLDAGEPTVSAIRVWEPNDNNSRRYLPSPNWLQEVLIDAIDLDKLHQPQGEGD